MAAKYNGSKYMNRFFDEILCRYCEMDKNRKINKKTGKVININKKFILEVMLGGLMYLG